MSSALEFVRALLGLPVSRLAVQHRWRGAEWTGDFSSGENADRQRSKQRQDFAGELTMALIARLTPVARSSARRSPARPRTPEIRTRTTTRTGGGMWAAAY